MSEVKKALFVCLGNICRSPIAEGVFQHLVKQRNIADKWVIDSAGIQGWHVGKQPDHRSLLTMAKHNVKYSNRARQIKQTDFDEFDYIFGMDEENMADLNYKAPRNCKAKLLLLGDFDPEGDRIIRDPYFDSGSEGFKKCFQQCMRCCASFLDEQ